MYYISVDELFYHSVDNLLMILTNLLFHGILIKEVLQQQEKNVVKHGPRPQNMLTLLLMFGQNKLKCLTLSSTCSNEKKNVVKHGLDPSKCAHFVIDVWAE
jgi:hypothetical protein